jgi:hypothetical protein
MRNILLILIALAIAAPTQAAEGRRTAGVVGFALGALTGWTVRDHMRTDPPAPQVVRYRDSYDYERPAPQVIERVVIVERPTPQTKEYVVIDGKAYEVVRATR